MAEEEEEVRKRINGEERVMAPKPRPCRTRTDRLAIPTRTRMLYLYKCHAYHFTRARVELIKQRLQELYAMTPEETERYFQEANDRCREKQMREKLRRMLRREYRKQMLKAKEEKAYRFVEQLFIKGMRFAARNPVPPLVCVRLRNLSDIVLEQLCDLRNVGHPSRDDPDKLGLFMITIADWFAIAIECIYFMVQLKKNKELEEIERQHELDKIREKLDLSKSDLDILIKPEDFRE